MHVSQSARPPWKADGSIVLERKKRPCAFCPFVVAFGGAFFLSPVRGPGEEGERGRKWKGRSNFHILGHVPGGRGGLAVNPLSSSPLPLDGIPSHSTGRHHLPCNPGPTVNNGERLPPIRVTTSYVWDPTTRKHDESNRNSEKNTTTRPPAPAPPPSRPSSLSSAAHAQPFRRRRQLATRSRKGTRRPALGGGGGSPSPSREGGIANREAASHHRPDKRLPTDLAFMLPEPFDPLPHR